MLFGGRRDFDLDDETWEYDGSVWTLRAPAQRPAAQAGHAMAYHATSGRVAMGSARP